MAPVCGLRPRLAALDLIKKVPKPEIITFSPRCSESRIKLKVELTASWAALLVREDFLATFSISSFFVISLTFIEFNLPESPADVKRVKFK